MFNKKAVFLDRDGTLLKAVYREKLGKSTAPFCLEELELAHYAKESLAALKRLGFLTIMVTNQPDVAYGHLTEDEWQKIQSSVLARLPLLDDVFMCRHPRTENCPFRKPNPGMLLAAADKWGIDLASSYMIGDTDADTGAGKAAGCKTILISASYNKDVEADVVAPGLFTAVCLIENGLI